MTRIPPPINAKHSTCNRLLRANDNKPPFGVRMAHIFRNQCITEIEFRRLLKRQCPIADIHGVFSRVEYNSHDYNVLTL